MKSSRKHLSAQGIIDLIRGQFNQIKLPRQLAPRSVNTGDIQQHYSVTSDPYLENLNNLAAGTAGNLDKAKDTVNQLLKVSEPARR